MKVLVPYDTHEKTRKFLLENGYELVEGRAMDEEGLKAELADVDGFLSRSYPYTRSVLESAKKLKVIGRIGVGTDSIDMEACNDLGIWVGIAKGANSNSVAEHTLAMMLDLSKNLSIVNRQLKAGDWDVRGRMIGCELRGKTLGILGMGAIGRIVASIAHDGFGMNILGYDVFWAPNMPEYVSRANTVDEILTQSDYVSLHVPSTPENVNMINKESLAKMKPHAILVNCARGALINEEDLYEALRDHVIAGAGLDVFVGDKPSPDNKLLTLDNVVVSPHYAAYSIESADAMEYMAAQAVDAVLKGGKPAFPVNKPVIR